MEWRWATPLSDVTIIEKVEKLIHYRYPEVYKKIVMQYNGAIPKAMIFDTTLTEERVFNNLISLEDGTLEGALDDVLAGEINQWSYDGLPWQYIPFGSDPFGNFICFDRETDHVVFFDHEFEDIEEVADSFTEFLDLLYDDDEDEE